MYTCTPDTNDRERKVIEKADSEKDGGTLRATDCKKCPAPETSGIG